MSLRVLGSLWRDLGLCQHRCMSQAFVLVVHENGMVLELLGSSLRGHDYECSTASTGREALAAIDQRQPDTVVLSVDLPSGDGIDLCRRVRARTRTPVIAISESDDETRKVATLDAGADDYLTMPLSMPEVLARIRVALRHRRELALGPSDSVIQIGALRIDPDGHAAMVGTRVLTLTPKEFQLLVLLARNADRVVLHQSILEAIWPNSKSQDALRLHISQLRKKLAPADRARSLVTLPGVGYKLSAIADT
jgi:two-component system, OmpR family, KDP operon response regulator KdpE